MTQDTKNPPAPTGVVYNTSMSRPGAALALGGLYVTASRREARVGGVCITGSGLDAAIFCDIVARFYTSQTRTPSSNNVLPVGFPSDTPLPPNPPMVAAAIARTREDGSPQYARGVRRVTDTSAPDAMLRNALTFTVETVVVLSAPATWLARSLELAATVQHYKQRVKRVVLVEAGGVDADAAALKRALELIPVPVVRCPPEVGTALTVSRAQIEPAMSWAPAHPVLDALRAAGDAPVPLDDLAAIHYALLPNSGFFSVTDGRMALNEASKDACLSALTALATSRPAPPPQRGG